MSNNQQNPSSLGQPTTEVQPTMSSHSDKTTRTLRPIAPAGSPGDMLSSIKDGAVHDLKSFLARPSVVATGLWSTSNATNSILASVTIPDDVVLAIPAFSSKIYGFMGFRAKTVITLQVNTNRFQQGLLGMSFFPQNKISVKKYNHVIADRMNWTQLPRIVFDAATDSQVTMEIPYVAPQLAFDTTSGNGSVGAINIHVYEPLATAAGTLNAEYVVWAHFEDVEVMFATASNTTIVPQSGGKKKMRMSLKSREPAADEVGHEGWLSSSLGRLKSAATIASEIPLLAPYTGAVSWMAGVAQRSALALGFSNPLNSTQPIIVQQRPFSKAMNVSGVDNCHNLAAFEDNHIQMMDGWAGQDVDEMALAYPLSIPTWCATTTWTDTDLPFATLATLNLSPSWFVGSGIIPGGGATTPLAYIANMFQYWRGSFKFKIRLVKTEFHSGRFALVFRATGNTSPTTSAANISLFHREIVDIGSNTTIDITIPYASVAPYLPVNWGTGISDRTSSIGTLDFVVINQLRRPDTVSSYIKLIVEVCGGPDMEFAVPCIPSQVPFINAPTAAPQSGGDKIMHPIYAQAADVEEQATEDNTVAVEIPESPIGTTSVPHVEMSPSLNCVGEKILSLRQLLKRSTNCYSTPNTAATSMSLQLYPWFMVMGYYDTTTSTYLSCDQPTDYYSYIGSCYGFMRGSVRLRSYTTSNNTTLTIGYRPLVKTTIQNFATSTAGIGTAREYCVPVVPSPNSVYPCPEISVPYYNNYALSNVVFDSNSPNTNIYAKTRPSAYVNTYALSLTGSIFVQRQGGDDLSFGFWTGTPSLVSSTYSNGRQAW